MLMSFFQRLSFRFVLFLVILVIGLTPLSFSVLFNLPKILSKFNELAEVEQVNKITQHVHSVELLLRRYEENMRIIGRLPGIRSLISAEKDRHMQPIEIRTRLTGLLGNWFVDQSMEELIIINSRDQLAFGWRNPLSPQFGGEIDRAAWNDQISHWSKDAREQKPGDVFITSLGSETLLVDHKHERSPKILMAIPLQDRQGKFGGVAVGKFFLFNQGVDPIPYDLMLNGAGTVFYDRRADVHDHIDLQEHQHQQETLLSAYPELAKATPETEYMFCAGNQGGKVLFYQVLPNQSKDHSLWVADIIDTSILDQWVSFFLLQFVILASLLIGGAMLVAYFVAGKTDRARSQLIGGVTDLVHDKKPIDLGWRWPLELFDLNKELNSLSTGLLAAEDNLQSQSRFIRGVFDGIQDGVAVIDRDFMIVDTNETLKKWRSDLLPLTAKTCHEVFRRQSSPCRSSCPSERAMNERSLQRDEFSVVELDGCEKWYEVTAYPIFGEDGDVESVVEFFRDITERKQAETEKQSLEQQLAFAQKMESIGTLAGGVAHDFNNMLSAINGYAELTLMKMDTDDPHREAMNAILQSGERAARLTQQLLAFSRKQIIQLEPMDLNEEIADIQKMLKRLLGEHINVVVCAGRGLWPVKADRTQVGQVLMNLAVNARDAMRDGGTLTIETTNQRLDAKYTQTHHELPSGDYVLLTVSDTGHGMSKETLAHVFEPFFTTKKKGKGTGLGLATSYGIIRQHGGSVHVYTETGQGTVFKVYLPRLLDQEMLQPGDPIAKEKMSSGGSETILLVEDDPMVRRICVDILKNFGYSILEAENGEDALQVFERYHGKIDLLLTDVVMPRMGGTELAEKIRKLSPDIRVIFMSGYTENAIVHNGILKEGIDFIHKPITPDSLAFGIRKVFDFR
ncbi:MAG: response regulator [Desulfocapsa sp.]|nr:response regulator [Desulfocapsa sp.]